MEKKELRMSPIGFDLFKKYRCALYSLDCECAVDPCNNYSVDINMLSDLNNALRRLSMTLEYVMANEVSEVDVTLDSPDK